MEQPRIRLDDLIALVNGVQSEGDALVHVTDAMILADRLGELADHLIGHFVDQARAEGATWSEIGRSLGVSKQAAQKRFVARGGMGGFATFSRFTDRARRAVVAAQDEARGAGHDYIGTEHVVLGLLHEPEALAVRALAEQGIHPDQLRTAITSRLDPPSEAVSEHPRFTTRAKEVRDQTVRAALRLGHNYVGTEHMLLGLLAERRGLGAQVIVGLGFDGYRGERWMLDQLAGIEAASGN